MTASAVGTIPYVVKVVRNYLVSVLDTGIVVATKVPATRPAKLVIIDTASTGDVDNIALSLRRVIIQDYAKDEITSGELSETIFGHLKSAKYVPGNGIRNVSVVGTPARFDDPDIPDVPRFQQTVDVLLRAVF